MPVFRVNVLAIRPKKDPERKPRFKPLFGKMLLAAVFGLCAAGCISKAKQHLYQAEDKFEKKDLPGAKAELDEAIKLDPDLLDAHKSLAHINEFMGDYDDAAREYDIASRLDPADQKLLNKARYYRKMRELAGSADKALADIKAGKAEEGLATLKDIIYETKNKAAHDKAIAALAAAGPLIGQQAGELAKNEKYQEAEGRYESAIRAYLMLAQASHKEQLDPAADSLIRALTAAAKQSGNPDRPFQLLNDVLAADPEDKTANTELAGLYLAHSPPDYSTAADLLERAGAPDARVTKLRAKSKDSRRGNRPPH